jgi:hypothetical protein
VSDEEETRNVFMWDEYLAKREEKRPVKKGD